MYQSKGVYNRTEKIKCITKIKSLFLVFFDFLPHKKGFAKPIGYAKPFLFVFRPTMMFIES